MGNLFAALRANYEGDKVFTKKEVAAAISTIDALQKMPAKERSELSTYLWRGYNERLNEQDLDKRKRTFAKAKVLFRW